MGAPGHGQFQVMREKQNGHYSHLSYGRFLRRIDLSHVMHIKDFKCPDFY